MPDFKKKVLLKAFFGFHFLNKLQDNTFKNHILILFDYISSIFESYLIIYQVWFMAKNQFVVDLQY